MQTTEHIYAVRCIWLALLKRYEDRQMINFEEELKKFHPSLEIEEAEDAIYNQDMTDMADLLVGLVKEDKESNNRAGK